MNAGIIVGLLLAAPPRIVAQVENVHEAGLFPVPSAEDFGASEALYRTTLTPSLEGRYETRNHELALRFSPRFLLQAPQIQDTDLVLDLYRGFAEHAWRFDRGAQLRSEVFVESGKRDFILESSAGGFAPASPLLASNRVGGRVAVDLETGEVESFTLFVGVDWEEPWEISEGTIFSTFRIETGVEYAHYLARRLDGVLDAGFEYLDFFDVGLESRRASLRGGLTWQPRPNLTWDARAGVQVIVGDQRITLDDVATENVQEVLPAGRLQLDWTFIESVAGVYTLTWDVELDAFVDPIVGTYVPQITTGAALGILQPWGSWRFVARAGTPLGDTSAADLSLSPTFYSFVATLDLPISEYVFLFFGGRLSQRAPTLGAENFEFSFTEAAGFAGIRLWWSSGRDPRLRRPSQILDSDEQE